MATARAAFLFLLATLALLPLAGCGPARPATVPVSGKITYGGGAFPAKGTIYFNTIKEAPGFPKRPSSVEIKPDGTFAAENFEGTSGLMPGTYQIRIECWEIPPSMEGKPHKSYLHKSMERDGTILENGKPKELVIEPGSAPVTLTLDIPKR